MNLLGDRVQISFPEIQSLNFNPNIPMIGPYPLSISRMFFSSFFYFGLGSALYSLFYITRTTSRKFFTYLRSIFNSKRFLNPLSPIAFQAFGNTQPELHTSRAYALIYGTGNRAGMTYAHYLAEKGFNLILIERDIQPLNDLENEIKEKFTQRAAS